MKKTIIGVLLLVLILFTSCNANYSIGGSGNIVEKSYEMSGFDSIDISNAFDVEVIQGDYNVLIQVDKAYENDLVVEERGDTLYITMKPGIHIGSFNRQMKAMITMPILEKIDAAGATDIYIQKGMKYEDSVIINLAGAVNMEADIMTEKVNFDLAGATRFTGILNLEYLNAEVAGASDMNIEGKANYGDVIVVGASSFGSKQFEFNTLKAEAVGASRLVATGNEEVSLEAFGASSIKISGSPIILFQDADISSSVSIRR